MDEAGADEAQGTLLARQEAATTDAAPCSAASARPPQRGYMVAVRHQQQLAAERQRGGLKGAQYGTSHGAGRWNASRAGGGSSASGSSWQLLRASTRLGHTPRLVPRAASSVSLSGGAWPLLERGCSARLALAWAVHSAVAVASWALLLQFCLLTGPEAMRLQGEEPAEYIGGLLGNFFVATCSSLLLQVARAAHTRSPATLAPAL